MTSDQRTNPSERQTRSAPAPELILASGSPRRRELLTALGVPFKVRPARLDEPVEKPACVTPAGWVTALAYFKAVQIAHETPDAIVLGADTLVACGQEILGKPRDRADAERMLRLQAGAPSRVLTGVALVWTAARVRVLAHDATTVWMRDAPELRNAYLVSEEWRGKAGAYGIQDIGDALVERIDGAFDNVVGLPVKLVRNMLAVVRKKHGPTP